MKYCRQEPMIRCIDNKYGLYEGDDELLLFISNIEAFYGIIGKKLFDLVDDAYKKANTIYDNPFNREYLLYCKAFMIAKEDKGNIIMTPENDQDVLFTRLVLDSVMERAYNAYDYMLPKFLYRKEMETLFNKCIPYMEIDNHDVQSVIETLRRRWVSKCCLDFYGNWDELRKAYQQKDWVLKTIEGFKSLSVFTKDKEYVVNNTVNNYLQELANSDSRETI